MMYKITDSADVGSKGAARIGNSDVGEIGSSNRTVPNQSKLGSVLHGNFFVIFFMNIL